MGKFVGTNVLGDGPGVGSRVGTLVGGRLIVGILVGSRVGAGVGIMVGRGPQRIAVVGAMVVGTGLGASMLFGHK